MLVIVLNTVLFLIAAARPSSDDYYYDESSSEECQETTEGVLNAACQVQGSNLKICRECDPQFSSGCLLKKYTDCRCRDIHLKNLGKD